MLARVNKLYKREILSLYSNFCLKISYKVENIDKTRKGWRDTNSRSKKKCEIRAEKWA